MAPDDAKLDRLLRGAVAAGGGASAEIEAPFGFDTRVVSLWRAQRAHPDVASFQQWLRRTAGIAVFIAAIATAGAYWEINDTEDLSSLIAAGDTIADNVIEQGALP